MSKAVPIVYSLSSAKTTLPPLLHCFRAARMYGASSVPSPLLWTWQVLFRGVLAGRGRNGGLGPTALVLDREKPSTGRLRPRERRRVVAWVSFMALVLVRVWEVNQWLGSD